MAVRIHEITMAAKDIVCVEIRDPEIVEGNMAGPLTPMPSHDYNTRYTLTNPRSGLLERGFVRGANKDYFRFDDTRPDLYYERAAGDVAANWGPIGARTVTNVWRKSFPYQSGYCEGTSGGHCNIAVFKHFVYLKLNGNLAQGSYTITPPAGTGLSAVPFVFNHKVTRCSSIHVSQVGMRPSDAAKTAYLSVWIPGAPNEGEITFDSTEFTIIDADGIVDYGSLPVVHRVDGHTLEENDITLNWYASTNYPSLKITNITNAAAAVFSYSGTGFVPVNGEVVMFRGMLGGMSQLEYWNAILTNVNTTAKTFNAYIVTHPNGNWDSRYGGRITLRSADTTANTVTSMTPHNWATGQGPVHVHFGSGTVGGLAERINYWVRKIDDYTLSLHPSSADASADTNRIDLTSFSGNPFLYGVTTDTTAFSPYSDVSFLDEYENRMYRCCVKNRPGTNVYGLDFSEWMMTADPGLFRLWVPDIGVSDPFRVDDDVWWDVAKNACGGIYNHRNGAALDGRFGWTRPLSFRGDVAMSKQPASWSSEAGIVGSGNALSSAVTDHPICMTSETFTDWFGSYHDAGDWDTFSCAHLYEFVNLLDVLMDRAPPEVRSQGFFGTPKSSAVLGELYAGTDDMPDIFHAAAWIFDAYRRLQREDGSVGGGLGYSAGGYTDTGSGPSWLPVPSGMTGAVIYGPDHHSNFCYAAAAAKFAIICLAEGFGSLGAVYRQSAIDAWDWAEEIFLDREGTAVTGAHDAFYLTECNLRNLPRSEPINIVSADIATDVLTLATGFDFGHGTTLRVTLGTLVGPSAGVTYFGRWLSSTTLTLHATKTDAENDTAKINITTSGTGTVYLVLNDTQYTEGRDLIHGHYARAARRAAAGTLFRLTGEAEYGDISGAPMIGQSTQGWNGNAMWEYAHAPAADPATRTALMSSFVGPGLHYEMDYSLGDIGYRNQGYKEIYSIPMTAEYRQLLWYLIAVEEEGTVSPPYTRAQVLNVLQAGRHFQHGANQNGICMTHGLDAPRVMETTLHEDSMRIGVDAPPGITNYGWDPGFFANGANLFSGDSPLVPVVEHLTGLYEDNYGSKRVYEPYRGSVPRMEFLVENPYWIHQNEYTFHQTITPDWAIAQWLHAHDGNTYSGGTPVEPGTVITMHWGEAPGEPEPEDPPTMTSPSSTGWPENTAMTFPLTASAPSTFAITGGADAAHFAISGSALTWSGSPPDAENPTDADDDSYYVCEVTPTTTPGGTVGVPQTFTAFVYDVVDTPPVMTSANTASVAENATLAHALTADIEATFAITGGADAAKFEISGTTLRWTGNATKDYEAPDDADLDRAYVVQVTPTHAVTGAGSPQTITVTLTDVADTVGYTTTSAHFDGSTRLVRGGGLTGAVNGPVAIFSVWIKSDVDAGGSRRMLVSDFATVTFHRSNTNKITVNIPSSAGPAAVAHLSVGTVTIASGWAHLLIAIDVVAGNTHLYINDVFDSTTTNIGGTDMKFIQNNWGVGAATDGFAWFNGDIADLYFNTVEWLDFSVEANRRKFITADLKPVDLGANGQLPTGNAPILFLNGGAAGFTTNRGTGGDFTVAAGTLTNGPTIP